MKAANLLPSRITEAINEPPICDMIQVIGKGKIVIFIKLELTKLAERIAVGNNITPAQMEFIATQLIEFFPGESLADFKICFERGCIGQYGDIFRMDGIVIRKWMEKYLDEKYQVIEEELKKEKDEMYRPVSQDKDYNPDRHQHWLDKLKEVCNPGQKVPGVSREEILRNGQQDPPKRKGLTSGYKYFYVRGVQIYASTQEHAEEIASSLVRQGVLEEVKN